MYVLLIQYLCYNCWWCSLIYDVSDRATVNPNIAIVIAPPTPSKKKRSLALVMNAGALHGDSKMKSGGIWWCMGHNYWV